MLYDIEFCQYNSAQSRAEWSCLLQAVRAQCPRPVSNGVTFMFSGLLLRSLFLLFCSTVFCVLCFFSRVVLYWNKECNHAGGFDPTRPARLCWALNLSAKLQHFDTSWRNILKVPIAFCYELPLPAEEISFIFQDVYRHALRHTQPSSQSLSRWFSLGIKRPEREADHCLVLRWRTCGVISLFTHASSLSGA
jgi:hypothetical protein